ncbi:hypothetical protein [Peribacillus sp. Bi134]|uniref:hypothetical protein n=1 Tax=Peribacillus sp. Bi134 TaxID=2884272 RepID=UPI001E569DDF|nr:hypothetical protein [Peribacillus sp. Bi134]
MISREELVQEINDFLLLNTYPSSKIIVGINVARSFDFTEIDPSLIPNLFRTQFLINPRVKNFINNLSDIRQRLARTTYLNEEVTSGVIKGPINWGKTITLRMSQGNSNFPLYVTKTRNKTFDIPQNRLLVYLLKSVNELFKQINTQVIKNLEDKSEWDYILFKNYIEYGLFEIQKTMALKQIKEIDSPSNIDQRLLDIVGNSRDDFYIKLYELYLFYDVIILQSDYQVLEESFTQALLERSKEEDLMEMAVVIKLLKKFSIKFHGVKRKFGLFSAEANYLVSWELPNGVFTISLYNLPPFINKTLYKNLLDQLGIPLKSRLPDISLYWQGEDGSKWVNFVEVKYTDVNSQYFRQSLYKVMGYLKDFEKWFKTNKQAPGVTLVIPSGLSSAAIEDDIYVTQFNDEVTLDLLVDNIIDDLP